MISNEIRKGQNGEQNMFPVSQFLGRNVEKMNVEILAPGGSKEAIYAGLACGADAIYTGTSRFSARAFADNPSVTELCEILDYAHLHGKKVYLTVNTLLTERELEEQLYEVLCPLYESGLDAVIVQDLGVMDYVHTYFPHMDIHASTQMSFVSGEAMNLLKPYGVTRVVPARELSIGEIRDVRKNTDLELEVFVHGALCYCYSGQCLMSKVIGGRSGNRGMCAQPCRLPYEWENGKMGYILSTKDMCTLSQVGTWIEAGVDSFKIEGRMKKPVYTAYTAHLYRIYADAWISGIPKTDKELQRDLLNLADIYNRGGFCSGYAFSSSKKEIFYPKKNGHYGVKVGDVTRVNKNTVEYKVTQPTQYQDVLEFRDGDQNAVYEYTVKEGALMGETVIARFKPGSRLKKGQSVFRTKNSALLSNIEEMMEKGKRTQQQAVRGIFTAKKGEPIRLVVYRGDYKSVAEGVVAEDASNRAVGALEVERRLKKTGNSSFFFEELWMDVDENLFFPLGHIAALRREAFEQLEQAILHEHHREHPLEKGKAEDAWKVQERQDGWRGTIITVTNAEQISAVHKVRTITSQNTRLHLKLDEISPEKWKSCVQEAKDLSYYISLPAVLRKKNQNQFLVWWKMYGECFNSEKCVGVIVNSLEAFPMLSQIQMEKKECLAGTEFYRWNRRTKKIHQDFGVHQEMTLAYGRTAVMISEGCVSMQLYGCRGEGEKRSITISTPKKDTFTVVNYCRYCYNVIYEKEASWHDVEAVSSGGMPEIRFGYETEEEVRKVLEQWNFLL